LQSALNQVTQLPFEVIVIDDCSTDNTEQVVKEYQKKFSNLRYHKQERNQGLAASRNRGVSLARGKYIIFLDDDDFLTQFVAEAGVIVLEYNQKYNVVTGGRLVINKEASQYNPPPRITEKSFYTTLDDGFTIRKSVFDEIQYDESLFTNEDADFGIQYMRKFKWNTIFVLNNILFLKFGHQIGSSDSWSAPSERTYLGMERYMKKNLPLYYEHGDKEEIEYILRYMGRLYCQGGKMRKGIPYLWKAHQTKPMWKNRRLLLASLGGPKVFNWHWRRISLDSRTKII
jgi:glycosyltransferase involved in cell wall biosynthesis